MYSRKLNCCESQWSRPTCLSHVLKIADWVLRHKRTVSIVLCNPNAVHLYSAYREKKYSRYYQYLPINECEDFFNVRACVRAWICEWLSEWIWRDANFNQYVYQCVARVLFIHTCRAHSLSRNFSELILRFVRRKLLTTNNNIINVNNGEILTIMKWWLY